jgi:UDP-glucose:(heptosyl)LPS alpha-1,3-glucosyltransferase
MNRMDVAFCYPTVVPARGGCETYISDLARRLARDGHRIHLYANRWDPAALPPATHFHRIDVPARPRFLRPWRFATACERALAGAAHDISIGFDKTWGQDILYPQGGLHAATHYHNRMKYRNPLLRWVTAAGKWFDPASWSFARLERKQYLGPTKPLVVVNSRMVRGHFERFLGIDPDAVRVVPSAIDPLRFAADDRLRRRKAERDKWGVTPDTGVGLFIAMNYRLKGLVPLLRALRRVPVDRRFKLVVVGHRKFAEFERLAAELGVADRVSFLGHRADPKDAYFAADFLVHPTFYDPCSLVVLEALACGLPVVTTRYNGAAELFGPDAGVIVDTPHDEAGLAGAIVRCLDPGFRSTAAVAARQAAGRWTFEHHYRALMAVFAEARQVKRAA